MVYSRTLKTSFSWILQHRLDITTEDLWILFEGHYTLIGSNMSRKFQIPLKIITYPVLSFSYKGAIVLQPWLLKLNWLSITIYLKLSSKHQTYLYQNHIQVSLSETDTLWWSLLIWIQSKIHIQFPVQTCRYMPISSQKRTYVYSYKLFINLEHHVCEYDRWWSYFFVSNQIRAPWWVGNG